jgi:release factor glutamine methyltransferase
MAEMTAGDWLVDASRQLKNISETPRQDAQMLLTYVTHMPLIHYIGYPESPLNSDDLANLNALLHRLVDGEPLPYILQEWEFYGLSFVVNPAVLIPRPETEMLVETACNWLDNHPACIQVADVGCGSGCIGISIARQNPKIQLTLVDISGTALAVCQVNVDRYLLNKRSSVIQADLLPEHAGKFDVICANLPYIPSKTLTRLPVAKHEPIIALDGGKDGLNLIRRLVAQLPHHLASPGLALLEIEHRQEEAALNIARDHLPDARIEVQHDIAGQPRMLVIERL